MKESVWLLHPKANPFPLVYNVQHTAKRNTLLILGVIGLWGVLYYFLHNDSYDTSAMIFGLVYTIISMLITFYFDTTNYFISINKKDKKIYYTDSPDDYMVLHDTKVFQFPNNHTALIVEKDYFKRLKVPYTPLHEFYNKSSHDSKFNESYDLILKNTDVLNQAYYLMVMVFTLALLVVKVNKPLFKRILPWMLLGLTFSLGQISLYFWTPSFKQMINILYIKQLLYTLSIGFVLTSISLVIQLNKI